MIGICYPFEDQNIEVLRRLYKAKVLNNKTPTRRELLEFVNGCEVVVTMVSHKVDKDFLDACGDGLKLVANYAVGFNNIDLDTCQARGILVTNTPGILTEAVAEHIMALILCISRNVLAADDYVRRGMYHGWRPELFVGTGVMGQTIGIVGMGRIGKWTARFANALGMKIVYFSNERDEEIEVTTKAVFHKLETLLSMADFVSLSVPLNKETHKLIGKRELSMMKESAVLINTSRGEVVDQKALIKALKDGVIAGAGLDVFELEDKIDPQLLKLKNVVLTPHIASATKQARLEMSRILVKGIKEYFRGVKPKNLVLSN